MPTYDLVQSVADHAGFHVADFWPCLIHRLSAPHVNGRSTEMIEIGGTNTSSTPIGTLFNQKRAQILQGLSRDAWVFVGNFATAELRLEKVR